MVPEAQLLISKKSQIFSKEPEATCDLASCPLPGHLSSTLHAGYAQPPVVSSTSQGVSSSGLTLPGAPKNDYSLTGFREGPRPSLRPENTKLLLLTNPITLGHTGTYPEQALPKEPLPPRPRPRLARCPLLLCTRTRTRLQSMWGTVGAEYEKMKGSYPAPHAHF